MCVCHFLGELGCLFFFATSESESEFPHFRNFRKITSNPPIRVHKQNTQRSQQKKKRFRLTTTKTTFVVVYEDDDDDDDGDDDEEEEEEEEASSYYYATTKSKISLS